MASLREAVTSSTQSVFTTDGEAVNGSIWKIGTEAVRVMGCYWDVAVQSPTTSGTWRWLVTRRIAGTAATMYAVNTAITEFYPEAPTTSGGGAHTHPESEVVNLATDLGAKALTGHNHDASYAPTHSHPYAATAHTHVDADLPAGLARDSEVAAGYSPLGHTHAHPDLATHDGLGLTTDAELATHAATPHGGSIPAGVIVMWGGLLSAIPATWALCDGLNGTPDLRSKFVKGAAAAQNPGSTGGSVSASYTPQGTNSAPALTMNAYTPAGTNSAPALTMNSYTPSGTNSAPTFTGTAATSTATSGGTPAGTNSAPAFTGGTDTSTAVSGGTPAGTNSAPTFTGSAATASASAVSPKLVTGNTSTGVSLTTTATGTVAAPTFTGSALATHTHNVTATGTVAAPTFTGSALATHTHSVTATGTVAAPTFTGSAATLTGSVAAPTFSGGQATLTGSVAAPTFTGTAASIATEPAYYALAYIQKL